MKIVATSICFAFLSSFSGLAGARDPVRLDSTTTESFEASFEKLVRSVKTREKRTLALGLFGALLKHDCLPTEVVLHLTFSPIGPKDAPLISPCRRHLDGMSYEDIIRAGQPPEGSAS